MTDEKFHESVSNMKHWIKDAGVDEAELTKDEYGTDLTLFMYNEYGKIDIMFQEIEFNQTVPLLTKLLSDAHFFDNIEDPEATTDYFVKHHNLIIDDYIKIKVDYLQNKTNMTNLFQIVI